MTSSSRDTGFFGSGFHEQNHIASHDNNVKGSSNVKGREIGLHPLQLGSFGLSFGKHLGVDIAACHIEPASGEFDGDSPRPTTSIEYRCRFEALNKVSFAVWILTRSCHLLPLGVIARSSGTIPTMHGFGHPRFSQPG